MIDASQPIFGPNRTVGYQLTGRLHETAKLAPSQDQSVGRSDQVTISAAAERAAGFGQVVSDAAKEAGPITPARLQDKTLPDLITDFETLMGMAEARLGELMTDLGIDRDTDIAITSHNNGTFSVESDHPKATALEAAINEDPEMRNALIGAHNTAIISRIAAAASKAMAAADAKPAMADTYYGWLQGVANETKAMDFRFSMENGDFVGSLIGAGGQSIALGEGLRLPA